MSHLTKIKSKIDNLVLLKQTLKDLNIQFNEADGSNVIKIKSWDKKIVDEKILLDIKTDCSYNVGVILNKKDNTYEFSADWWGIETYTGVKQEDFVNKIMQKYAYNNLMDKIRDKGYSLVTEEVDDKNNIRVVLRKWQ
jgi:hypothetical protein